MCQLSMVLLLFEPVLFGSCFACVRKEPLRGILLRFFLSSCRNHRNPLTLIFTLHVHMIGTFLSGGNFIWPGVEVGHVQTVRGLDTLGSIDMKTLSMEPLV